MSNGIDINIFYYEIILVLLSIIVYFIIDSLEKRRDTPFNRMIHLSPLLFIVGIILARIVFIFFPNIDNNFNGFSIVIYYYALIIITGAIMAAVLATKEAKRRGFNPDFVWDMLPWVLLAGIIGARLWHVLTPQPDLLVNGKNPYFINPLEILNFRRGGLGIPGGVIAGALALFFYARKKKINFLIWADIIVPGVALAQGIGRWGNFFNQELYGLVVTTSTKFPWAIYIDPGNRLPNHQADSYYMPTFFYEFLWNLFNMGILLLLPRKIGNKMKPGDNFLVYIFIYSIGRFVLEFIRFVPSTIEILGKEININMVSMAVVAIISACILVWRHIKKKETADEMVERSSAEE